MEDHLPPENKLDINQINCKYCEKIYIEKGKINFETRKTF